MGGLILVVHAVLLAWNANELGRHLDVHTAGSSGILLTALRVLAILGAGGLGLRLALRRPASPPPFAQSALHLILAGGGALVAATLARALLAETDPRWTARAAFFAALALGQGRALRDAGHAINGSPRKRREIVAFNLLASLILLEAAATFLAARWPTPLLAGPEAPVRIAALRDEPGRNHYGSPMNDRGYYDDAFFAAGPEDLVVTVHSDSFGPGIVPRRYNFVDVAEARVRDAVGPRFSRVALHNFGIVGVSINVHRYVHDTEALPLRPALVVLAVFVGNDILDGHTYGTPLIERYALQEWYVASVVQRALSLWRASPEERAAVRALGRDAVPAAVYPPAVDPGLQLPTYSPETFARIELRRMEVSNVQDRDVARRWSAFTRGLEAFHEVVGERLLVMLIPDVFQVDDALYDELRARSPEVASYPRFLPQERLLALCRQRGMHCLDLLPALRAAESEGRTYHPRDTHWNALGNRVAGERLADALLERLAAISEPESRAQSRRHGPPPVRAGGRWNPLRPGRHATP